MNYVASYPWCSIASRKEPLQSCFPSQDKVSKFDHVIYPMGEREPFLSPIGPSDFEYLIESDIIFSETSSPRICESSSPSLHDFLDVKFPSNEAIIEAMIIDGRPWENMHHRLFFLPEHETL